MKDEEVFFCLFVLLLATTCYHVGIKFCTFFRGFQFLEEREIDANRFFIIHFLRGRVIKRVSCGGKRKPPEVDDFSYSQPV